jgi:hypothetical protein
MDRIDFELAHAESNPAAKTFLIIVNGERLESLARVVEMPFAEADGHPNLAGDYAPLTLFDIRSDVNHFLTKPVATWFEDGDAVLMGCPCGEWGCWPLTVKIEVNEATIVWSEFRNGHRDWDLSGLGPFTFDRVDYEVALHALVA